MKIPLFGALIDERFLAHRLRSTSLGGIAAIIVAVALFECRLFHDHVWNWDLIAVALTGVVVKMGAFTWYRIRD